MGRLVIAPQYLTLHHGYTFLVTRRNGDIDDPRTGLYDHDTRYLSHYRVLIDGFPLTLLSSLAVDYLSAVYYFANPRIGAFQTTVEPNDLVVKLSRSVVSGLHEEYTITNYAGRDLSFDLILQIESDFADIMEVRRVGKPQPRLIQRQWDRHRRELLAVYRNGSFLRQLALRVAHADSQPDLVLGRTITFKIRLPRRGAWSACLDWAYAPEQPASPLCSLGGARLAREAVHQDFREWERSRGGSCMRCATAN